MLAILDSAGQEVDRAQEQGGTVREVNAAFYI